MPSIDPAKLTKAQLIEALREALTAAPAAPSEASQHWTERDITCNAPKACKKTFRTAGGRDWHVANVKH